MLGRCKQALGQGLAARKQVFEVLHIAEQVEQAVLVGGYTAARLVEALVEVVSADRQVEVGWGVERLQLPYRLARQPQ